MKDAFGVEKSFSLKYGWKPITALGSSGIKPMPKKGLKTISGSHAKAYGRQSKKDMRAAEQTQEASDETRRVIDRLKAKGKVNTDGIKITSTGTTQRKSRAVQLGSSKGSKKRGPGLSGTSFTLPRAGETNRTAPAVSMVGEMPAKFKVPDIKRDWVPQSYKEVKNVISGKTRPPNTKIANKVKSLAPKKREKILGTLKSHKKEVKAELKEARDKQNGIEARVKEAKWHVKNYNKPEIADHEIKGHATRRKAASAYYRINRHPEKLWGDEARSDSMMSDTYRKRGAYSRVAFDGAHIPMDGLYREGLKRGGAKKYRATTRAIERAKGSS